MSPMQLLSAGALKLGIKLSSAQLGQFESYYDELINWNRKMNLTAITDYDGVQIKHFLDSLTAVLDRGLESGAKVIDVGTGAGIPGIPLKIVFPGMQLVLLDATAKKATFLQEVVEKLKLRGVQIVVGRAEEVAHQTEFREKFSLVLSRAVAELPALVELTLSFAAIGGRFIAQKKGDIRRELSQATRAIALMGGRLRAVKGVKLEEFTDERCLVIIDKVTPTPPAYPRRPGMPARRPII